MLRYAMQCCATIRICYAIVDWTMQCYAILRYIMQGLFCFFFIPVLIMTFSFHPFLPSPCSHFLFWRLPSFSLYLSKVPLTQPPEESALPRINRQPAPSRTPACHHQRRRTRWRNCAPLPSVENVIVTCTSTERNAKSVVWHVTRSA